MSDATKLKSPCINQCVSLDTGGTHCTGCYRTAEERAAWNHKSDYSRIIINERALTKSGNGHLIEQYRAGGFDVSKVLRGK